MRHFPNALAPGMILAIVIFSQTAARDDKVGAAAQERPLPPADAEGSAGPTPQEHGSTMGLFIDNHPNMGSFFFAERSGNCHYSFPLENASGKGGKIYWMFSEKMRLIGSDRNGQYWHYRIDRPVRQNRPWPLVKDWYIPKAIATHSGIWYKTDEPEAEPIFYGRPVEFGMIRFIEK